MPYAYSSRYARVGMNILLYLARSNLSYMVKTPDMNYNDPVLEKKGFLSRLFGRKKKDDPLAPTLQPYTRQEIALIEAERKRKAHEDFMVKEATKQRMAQQQAAQTGGVHASAATLHDVEMQREADMFVEHDFKTPAHLNPTQSAPTPAARMVTPQDVAQATVIAQQAIPAVATPSKLNKFINVAITAFAFIIGMVGVNIVYNQLPTYPMVTVGIVAIAVSAGIVTNMAR
jgi:hypothetical protein